MLALRRKELLSKTKDHFKAIYLQLCHTKKRIWKGYTKWNSWLSPQKSKLKLKIFRMIYVFRLPVRLTCDNTKTFAVSPWSFLPWLMSWRATLSDTFQHNISLAVVTTALRSSPIRQQYKNGFMDEFISTKVVAKFHSFFHNLYDWCVAWSVNKIYSGI